MSHPLRLLVTGFGAFPGVPENPTARLARWLGGAARGGAGRHLQLVTAVLPVEWRAAKEQAEDLFARYDPDMALHFGAHRHAVGFRIEQWARNTTSIHPDASGRTADGHELVPRAPRALRAPLSAVKIAQRLNRLGLPAVPSFDAGRYLCNALYFLSLERARRGGRPRLAQFVHVPVRIGPDGAATPPLSREALQTGALALIACLAMEAGRIGRRASVPAENGTPLAGP